MNDWATFCASVQDFPWTRAALICVTRPDSVEAKNLLARYEGVRRNPHAESPAGKRLLSRYNTLAILNLRG